MKKSGKKTGFEFYILEILFSYKSRDIFRSNRVST